MDKEKENNSQETKSELNEGADSSPNKFIDEEIEFLRTFLENGVKGDSYNGYTIDFRMIRNRIKQLQDMKHG